MPSVQKHLPQCHANFEFGSVLSAAGQLHLTLGMGPLAAGGAVLLGQLPGERYELLIGQL